MAKLREAKKLQAQRLTIPQLCKRLGVGDQTFYRWRLKYGALKEDEAQRLRTLEAENARLKRIVAEQALDISMLKYLHGEAGEPVSAAGRGGYLMRRQRVSEQRACQVVRQHLSTSRYTPVPGDCEEQLVAAMHKLAGAHPRYGYPRVHVLLVRDGWTVNLKRVERLWRRGDLRVSPRPKDRGPKWIGTDEFSTSDSSESRLGVGVLLQQSQRSTAHWLGQRLCSLVGGSDGGGVVYDGVSARLVPVHPRGVYASEARRRARRWARVLNFGRRWMSRDRPSFKPHLVNARAGHPSAVVVAARRIDHELTREDARRPVLNGERCLVVNPSDRPDASALASTRKARMAHPCPAIRRGDHHRSRTSVGSAGRTSRRSPHGEAWTNFSCSRRSRGTPLRHEQTPGPRDVKVLARIYVGAYG